MSTRLADLCKDRNNNFDILRFIAALMVLLSHSFDCFGIRNPKFCSVIVGGSDIFCYKRIFDSKKLY